MFLRKPSVVAQAIIDSLESKPDQWHADQHKLYIGSKESWNAPIRIWIANGIGHVDLEEPKSVSLLPKDKKQVWKAFQQWQRRAGGIARFLEILKAAEEWSGATGEQP